MQNPEDRPVVTIGEIANHLVLVCCMWAILTFLYVLLLAEFLPVLIWMAFQIHMIIGTILLNGEFERNKRALIKDSQTLSNVAKMFVLAAFWPVSIKLANEKFQAKKAE